MVSVCRCGLLPLVCLVAVLLCACRGNNPVQQTFSNVLPRADRAQVLLPGVEYLQVSVNGRVGVMALGERRVQTRGDVQDMHEYWYTGQGEMLHLHNGRIAQALGLTHELRRQAGEPPAWRAVLAGPSGVAWARDVDLMPGYRYGVAQRVHTGAAPAPMPLPQGVPAQVQWVEDWVDTHDAQGVPWRYRQVFALLNGQVVYSEQCIARDACFRLRHLAASEGQP